MRQLFQNLVSNALKFQRSDIPPHVHVVGDATDRTARIEVRDNSIGFRTEDVDELFKPGERLHDGHRYDGTGMGLAICRKIVEQSGGTVTARGVPEAGATFIVELPIPASSQEHAEKRAGAMS